jgi:multidrug efflux pump subunit AcrA (membrane-fusion protein)
MRSLLRWFKKHKTKLIVVSILVAGGYYYVQTDRTAAPVATAVVVEQVGRGDVTSGIETTGEIIAAQKLDLDVYKQTTRIDLVNVVNGGAVATGDVLLAFDASDVLVEVQSSRVGVLEAQLTLQNRQADLSDPNSTLRTLENDIAASRAVIAQAEVDKTRAYRAYLNANLVPIPGNKATENKIPPVISGLYTGNEAGEYQIELYRSNAESNYSYRVSGLETSVASVIFGLPQDVGSDGLEITFPGSLDASDVWIVAVPNVHAPQYVANRETYDQAITDLELRITNAQVAIANNEQEIANILQTDSTQARDTGVARAAAQLAQAREQLSQNFDVVQDQNIVAPFAGTIEGMENVVVGATPTRDTNDPISLGTLISNDFLATFSLSAVDVAKVQVGQLVLVNVTSFPDTPTLFASITEISSLPNSDGVAQYEVQALIAVPDDLPITLREGLLADIEIVEEVATDVVRVPSAAITYENKQAQVRILEDITTEQQATIDRLSIVRTQPDQPLGFMVDVEIGVAGAFYSEVVSGIEPGQYLIIGDTNETESVVTQPGRGGGRPANTQ